MLEAVRLMEYENSPPIAEQQSPSALVIGLGIGTSPAALSKHGINTTTVEIDPVVTKYARQYFDFPENIKVFHQDAFQFLRSAEKDSHRYDYIIHDVFTGGAEPLQLFTDEFFRMLRQVAKPNGRIAINYGGDFNLRATKVALQTIVHVFSECKAFRDSDFPDQGYQSETDMTNMVTFCSVAKGKWRFRQPVEKDFLQSQSRRQNLLPFLHREISLDANSGVLPHGEVFRMQNLAKWDKFQLVSAIEHWKSMRAVLPDIVWENW